MKEIKENVLYFHDYMVDEGQVQSEINDIKTQFQNNGLFISEIKETEIPPFNDKQLYDILLFDWGGASLGNSFMDSFCEEILRESLERPNKIYIMTSSFTRLAMEEALTSFEFRNGSVPSNVFLEIDKACKFINEYTK